MPDVVIFLHENGRDYVANVDGTWFRWPAERDGWRLRTQVAESEIVNALDDGDELEPQLADLAVRLSGASF